MKILIVIILCSAVVASVILLKNGSFDEITNAVDSKIGGLTHNLTDSRDGKSYRTVTIGTQTWMAENLNYDYGKHGTGRSFCYGDVEQKCTKYGRLYNYAAVTDSARILENGGICPVGWRLPSVEDWEKLAAYIGRSGAGIKLKSRNGWINDGYGTDEYDFSVVPAGYREKRKYKGEGFVATFWTMTIANNKVLEDVGAAYGKLYLLTNNTQSLDAAFLISAMNPKRAKIAYFAGNINGVDISNATGSHSVRCVKNDAIDSEETRNNNATVVKKGTSGIGVDAEVVSEEFKDIFKAYIALQEAYYSETGIVGSFREIGFAFGSSYFDLIADKQKGLSVTPKKKIGDCSVGKKIAVYPYSENGSGHPKFKCKIDDGCDFLISSFRSKCK